MTELTIDQAIQQGIEAHKAGQVQEAERFYTAILKAQPKHPDANHNMGVLAVGVGKVQEALPFFKTALEANPTVAAYWISFVDTLIKLDKSAEAKAVLDQAKGKGARGIGFDKLEQRLIGAGEEQLEKSNVAVAEDPEQPNILDTLKLDQALKLAKKQNLKAKNPSQQQLTCLLELYQKGKLSDAEKLAISITQDFPKHQFGWKVLGAVLKQTGRINESLIAMQKSAQLSPEDAEAHTHLGATLQELGKLDKAVASHTQAIVTNPNYPDAHYNLGITLLEQGRLAEAAASYTQAIALKPDFAEAHYNLGNTLLELQRPDEAEASYKQAIAVRPSYAEAYSNLGNTLLELERLSEAKASLTQAILLKPDFPLAHGNLALTLNALGMRESALAHFRIRLDLERGSKLINSKHKSFTNTSKAKISHDIEQFEYLADSGYDTTKFSELAAVYRTVASEINCASDTEIVPLSDKHRRILSGTYNRPFHILEAPLLDEPTVSKSLNVSKITNDYFSHDFGLTYIDEFLSPKTLTSLRDFLLGSTIWFDFFYDNGYIGANLKDGLASPLILQIAEDLRVKLPKIFKHHKLTQLWAYKYDSRARDKAAFNGISVHADFAAINVNFWITPKSANLNKSTGGLVVYNAEAPQEWNFKTYNTDEKRIREEISKNGGNKKVIPYNENRAVIFNSNLFHETDSIDFKDGYENRRINVTMLFGKRES